MRRGKQRTAGGISPYMANVPCPNGAWNNGMAGSAKHTYDRPLIVVMPGVARIPCPTAGRTQGVAPSLRVEEPS
jgi:hypothetical protein